MSCYDDRILPHLTHLAMRNRTLLPYLERVLLGAEGRVLEIGIGSGLNLPFYGSQAKEVLGLDPSPRLIAIAERAARGGALPVHFIEGAAAAIPLERGGADKVLTHWTPLPHSADIQNRSDGGIGKIGSNRGDTDG